MTATAVSPPVRNAMRLGWKRNYFSVVSGILLGLSVWAFSDNLFWDIGQPSNRDPKFVIHGLFCLGWMIAFFCQANFARAGYMRRHRLAGKVGFALAAGVIATTFYVFVAVFESWHAMTPFVLANRLLMTASAVLLALGYLHRARPDAHKRFVTIATLCMLEPVLSRVFGTTEPLFGDASPAQFDTYWALFVFPAWFTLFGSLFVYDVVVLRRIHRITLGGFVAFSAILAVCYLPCSLSATRSCF